MSSCRFMRICSLSNPHIESKLQLNHIKLSRTSNQNFEKLFSFSNFSSKEALKILRSFDLISLLFVVVVHAYSVYQWSQFETLKVCRVKGNKEPNLPYSLISSRFGKKIKNGLIWNCLNYHQLDLRLSVSLLYVYATF